MYTWWKKLDKNTQKGFIMLSASAAAGAVIGIVTYETVMGARGYKMVLPVTMEGSDVLKFMDRKGKIWNAKA